MEIIKTDGTDERFVMLCGKLDEFLSCMNGKEKQKNVYDQYNSLAGIHDVVLALEDGIPAGCGSLKEYGSRTGEIKRVYVREEYRRNGTGRKIIEALEALAKDKGYDRLILETGVSFTGATHLYKSQGYRVIENYGQYAGMKDSLCMEKIVAWKK